MKKLILFFGLITILFSCNTTEPPPPQEEKPTLTLTLEDASSIEAWIKLTTNNLQLPATVNLEQNNNVTQDIILSNADTVIYIDSLLPNTTYLFQVSSIEHPVSSNQLQVTTMDTTSHNFTWQTWTFGEHSSSVLYDIAIIDENNIWAVGEIFLNDSLDNPDPIAYNAVQWDGNEWRPKKITVTFRGNMITPTLEGVFAFSGTDIWFVGSLPIHGDGTNWTMYDLRTTVDPNLSLSIAWGSNSNDMYFIGRSGSIARYNGSVWTKIESGTDLNINDIWGDYNNKTGAWEILAVASNILHSYEKEVIKINSANTEILNKDGIDETLSGLWFKPHRKYYVVGLGIYEKNKIDDKIWKGDPLDITNYFIYKVRGIEVNDIATTGGFGEVLHFNGMTWKSYFDEAGLNYGNYYSVAIKDNIIIAVGIDNPQAVITMGKRIN